MDIKILSKTQMLMLSTIKPEKIADSFVISISDSNDIHPAFVNEESNILPLVFDDVTRNAWNTFPKSLKNKMACFSDNHANKVIEFINRMDKSKTLYTQCFAGKSRSSAIAIWVQSFFGTSEEIENLFKLFKPTPNEDVLATLNKISGISKVKIKIQDTIIKKYVDLYNFDDFNEDSGLFLPKSV